MIDVLLSTEGPRDSARLLGQTPGGRGRWGNCVFHVNEPVAECDYWVVYDVPRRLPATRCDPRHVILITGEPPVVLRYRKLYLEQFSRVVTCQRDLRHPQVTLGQQGLPWRLGRRQQPVPGSRFSERSYDELKAIGLPAKEKELSLICSTASGTAAHRRRNAFVEALQASLGERVDVYGRGRREIEDKWDALAPYKYTIVLENSSYPDYWTEKLSDAFLAGCFPFYFGCPNLADYFPRQSFEPIDLGDVEKTVDLTQACMANAAYEQSLPALEAAKDLVMDRYNLFALIADLCHEPAQRKEWIELRPHRECLPVWKSMAKRALSILRPSAPSDVAAKRIAE